MNKKKILKIFLPLYFSYMYDEDGRPTIGTPSARGQVERVLTSILLVLCFPAIIIGPILIVTGLEFWGFSIMVGLIILALVCFALSEDGGHL